MFQTGDLGDWITIPNFVALFPKSEIWIVLADILYEHPETKELEYKQVAIYWSVYLHNDNTEH